MRKVPPMTLPRPRFTVRRLMVAVAIVAVVLRMGQLSLHYRERSLHFYGRAYAPVYAESANQARLAARIKRDLDLSNKYWRAMWLPFLPLPTDLPEPE